MMEQPPPYSTEGHHPPQHGSQRYEPLPNNDYPPQPTRYPPQQQAVYPPQKQYEGGYQNQGYPPQNRGYPPQGQGYIQQVAGLISPQITSTTTVVEQVRVCYMSPANWEIHWSEIRIPPVNASV